MIGQRLRWSRGSVLAFSTQVCGFKPGRSRRIFRAKKIFSTTSFRGEVKPSVPCRRFAACKRFLNLRGSRNLGPSFSPTVLPFAARHLAAEVGTSKGGGKQWQTTPKNLPRMQCARAMLVIWLGSGSCQARPSRLNINEWTNSDRWFYYFVFESLSDKWSDMVAVKTTEWISKENLTPSICLIRNLVEVKPHSDKHYNNSSLQWNLLP